MPSGCLLRPKLGRVKGCRPSRGPNCLRHRCDGLSELLETPSQNGQKVSIPREAQVLLPAEWLVAEEEHPALGEQRPQRRDGRRVTPFGHRPAVDAVHDGADRRRQMFQRPFERRRGGLELGPAEALLEGVGDAGGLGSCARRQRQRELFRGRHARCAVCEHTGSPEHKKQKGAAHPARLIRSL